MNLNLFILQEHFDRKVSREFAYFVLIKEKYNGHNSTMRNFNYHKASNDWNINRSTVKNLVKFWLELGWCKTENDNRDLFFVHQNKCRSDHYKRVIPNEHALGFHHLGIEWHDHIKTYVKTFNPEKNVNKILDQFRLLLLQWTQDKFEWSKRMQADKRNTNDYKDILEDYDDQLNLIVDKKVHKYPSWKPSTDHPVIDVHLQNIFFLSFNKISRIFNCSITMAKKYIDSLQNKNLIQVFRKQLGFDKNWLRRNRFDCKPNRVFYGRPSRENWCDFNQFAFPNAYIF